MSNLAHALRDADWLNARRAHAYLVILAVISAFVAAAYVSLSHRGLDPSGKALGTDFASFWTASQLALEQRPDAAWRMDAHGAAQVARFGTQAGYAAFFYPPPFLLACLPLAMLDYPIALLLWLIVTGAAYTAMARAWLGPSFGLLPILAFPAVLVNAGHGQNGFLTAALLGGAISCNRRHPWLSGVLIGALIIKPHLAVLAPVFLILTRNGRGLAAAATTAIGLSALSWLAFGSAAWSQFIATSSIAGQTLEQDLIGYAKMQSVFAGARLIGAPLMLAWFLQAAAAIGAVAILWRIRQAEATLLGAAFVCATLLTTPFLLDYDLTVLAVPLAVLLRAGSEGHEGFRSWERLALGVGFILPLVARPMGTLICLPMTPFVVAALLSLLLARATTRVRAPVMAHPWQRSLTGVSSPN
jgi:alpha-1,2-mannosyltransferase